MCWTTSPTPSRSSSMSPSPTARAISRPRLFIVTASPSTAARRALLRRARPAHPPAAGRRPPLFRPFAPAGRAEKRSLPPIARLDTLGAITRGQRQTGGQGLFRPEDNLESHYGRDALRQLY